LLPCFGGRTILAFSRAQHWENKKMRSTLSALVIAAGLIGFGASAQAAPAAAIPGVLADTALVQVQLSPRERRMMRHHRMERRMMRRHRMDRRMMRHHRMERRMMHRRMHRM
jgi:hypothetical protein